jgi:hypothetical protein
MHKIIFLLLFPFYLFLFSSCSINKESYTETNISNSIVDISEPGFTLFKKNHVPNSDKYDEGGILLNQNYNSNYNQSSRVWQGIPSIGKDRSGNLYTAWVTGGKGEGNENYLTLSLSKDNGRSWYNDKLIIFVNSDDSTRVADPCFFNDKYDNLYMAWHKYVQKKDNLAKEWAVVWYSKLDLDQNGSISYTSPRKIAEGSMLNKPYYSKISDEVLFPIARWYEGNGELHQPFIYSAKYGTNNLINFSKIGAIPVKSNISGIHEHMLVQINDGSYFAMIRTFDGIHFSRSLNGRIWDMSKKFTYLGDTTVSRFHLSRLKSGRLIFIYNNSLSRSNLTICLSDDDGLTWPHKMILDASNHVSYPDLIETDPGVLNIVYDFSRTLVGKINFVQLKEESIINKIYEVSFRSVVNSLKQ